MTIFRCNIWCRLSLAASLLVTAPVLARDQWPSNEAELAQADIELNATYQRLNAQLTKGDRRALKISERTWLSQIQRTCSRAAWRAGDEATVMGPGAAAQMTETLCRLEATRDRALFLRSWRTK